jgi:Putative Ig domain
MTSSCWRLSARFVVASLLISGVLTSFAQSAPARPAPNPNFSVGNASSLLAAGNAGASASVDVEMTLVFLGGGDGTLNVEPPGKTYSSQQGGDQQDSFATSAGTLITLTPEASAGSFFDGFQSGGYCGSVDVFGYFDSWSCQAEPSGNPSDPAAYSTEYTINVGLDFETCPSPGTYIYGQGGITQGADSCPGVTVEGVPPGPLRGGVTATGPVTVVNVGSPTAIPVPIVIPTPRPPITFSLGAGQQLPPGMSLNPSTGVVFGTPTAPGRYAVTITETDSSHPPQQRDVQLQLEVRGSGSTTTSACPRVYRGIVVIMTDPSSTPEERVNALTNLLSCVPGEAVTVGGAKVLTTVGIKIISSRPALAKVFGTSFGSVFKSVSATKPFAALTTAAASATRQATITLNNFVGTQEEKLLGQALKLAGFVYSGNKIKGLSRVFTFKVGNKVFRRIVDVWDPVTKTAYEVKVGYTAASARIRLEVFKDAVMLKLGLAKATRWVFVQSPTTGEIGPSKPLAELLRKYGIQILYKEF